jgi:hypothetical protein
MQRGVEPEKALPGTVKVIRNQVDEIQRPRRDEEIVSERRT